MRCPNCVKIKVEDPAWRVGSLRRTRVKGGIRFYRCRKCGHQVRVN